MKPISSLLLLLVLSACLQASKADQSVVLWAKENSFHDESWESRPYYFKPTWGIKGSGVVEEGYMRFDSFPGASGLYEIYLNGIIEQDGSSHYAVYASDRLLKKGRFGYAKGHLDCNARGRVGDIHLGAHQIEKGDTIKIWGKSVYECGKKGAYALWYSISFKPVTNEKG